MSLMSSLYIGVSGLTTSQNSLNTTAHNLANINTPGYVRQQVVQKDSSYLNLGVNHISTLQTGLGVSVETVRQVRSMFLDKSYRTEIGRQGFYDTQYEAVQEVESMFGELEGVAFQDSLGDLWTSIQELAKDPNAIEVRATLVTNAQSFLERASNISHALSDYQTNLNTQIKDKVDRINEIADGIKDLNGKISLYESNGVENANDLRDQRNNLLDELGGLIDITYKENANGVVTVNAEGTPLVSEVMTFKMETAKVSAGSTLLKPVWSNTGEDVFNLDKAPSSENNTDVGSLKGLLVSRGSDEANYTDIPIRDNYASDADYQDAVEDYNNQINVSVIMTVQAQFDQLIHGVVTAINDIFSPNDELTLPNGTTVKYLDTANAPVGLDEDKTMGEALFNRKSVDRYRALDYSDPADQYIIDNSGGKLVDGSLVYNDENTDLDSDPNNIYTLFTLGEIEINPEILNNYSKLPLSSNSGSGEVDIDTTNALLNMWDTQFASLSPNSLTVCTFKDYYNAFTGDLATRGEQLNTISENQEVMVQNIDDQRQQMTGVSSDEELTNLIKFQQAYNASSRFFTVIDQMLEHIVTRL